MSAGQEGLLGEACLPVLTDSAAACALARHRSPFLQGRGSLLYGWLLAEASAQDFVSKRDLRSRDSGWRVPSGAGSFVHTPGGRVLTRVASLGCGAVILARGVLVPPCFLSTVL